MSKHTLIWLDHTEARIFQLEPDAFEAATIHAPSKHVHRHPKGASEAKEHPSDAKNYFCAVAEALRGAQEILLVGPGTGKLHFLRYAHEHEAKLAALIVGIETVDHPSDKQLVAYAQTYFGAASHTYSSTP